jgi:CRISPR-associated protein Cst2
MNEVEKQELKGFLVFDIVFEGQSLNYDQGIGNYQELKKIHKNGKVYTIVSRYALRYSILEQAKEQFGWKLADREILTEVGKGKQKVIQPEMSYNELENLSRILDYEDLNLFGFLITNFGEKAGEIEGISLSRSAPVRITHAISLEPFKFDSHFNVNLGLARRYYGSPISQNIFQIEEHRSYYKYSVVIDLNRIGKFEAFFAKGSFLKNEKDKTREVINKIKEIENKSGGKIILNEDKDVYRLKITNNKENSKLILQLVEVLLNLKRRIKGRIENLEPTFMVVAYYENFYDTLLNDIKLETNKSRVTEIEEKKENEKFIKIIRERSFDGVSFNLLEIPRGEKFLIYAPSQELISDQLANKIKNNICYDKQYVLETIKEWLNIKNIEKS